MISRLRVLLLQENELNVHRALRFVTICENWTGEDFTLERARMRSSRFSSVDLDELIFKMTRVLGDDFARLVQQSIPLLSSDEAYVKDFGFYTAILNPNVIQETQSTYEVLSEKDPIPVDSTCKLSRSNTKKNLNEMPDRTNKVRSLRSRESWCAYPYIFRVFAVCCGDRENWYSKS